MPTNATRLLDVNVLLALTLRGHPQAEAAHRWFATLPSNSRWATCPQTELSFVRLLSQPAITGQELSMASALQDLAVLHDLPGFLFLADPTSLAHTRIDLTALIGTKQVTDFHLVNLAASSDAVLATFDRRIAEALAPEDRKYVELIPA